MRFILMMTCLSGVMAIGGSALAVGVGATIAESITAGTGIFTSTLTLGIHIAVFLRGSDTRR